MILVGSISYDKYLGKRWANEGGVSFSHNTDYLKIDNAQYQRRHELLDIKQKFTHKFNNVFKIKTGAEMFLHDYSETDKTQQVSQNNHHWQAAIFSEARWSVSNLLSVQGGLRGHYAYQTQHFTLEPRLAFAVKPYQDGNISLAAGAFSQEADAQISIKNPQIEEAHAKHIQLSFQHGSDKRFFKVESYFKKYNDLPVLENGVFQSEGKGVAKGIDFFFRDKKSIKNLDYWVTYDYVHSRRSYNQYTSQVQPTFAPTHSLSVVSKYWIPSMKTMLGGTFSWNSGYPYNNPNLPGEMNSVSPNYGDLSLSLSYLLRQNLIEVI